MAVVALGAAVVAAGSAAVASTVAVQIMLLVASMMLSHIGTKMMASKGMGPRRAGDVISSTSQYGQGMPLAYGLVRVPGNIIDQTTPRVITEQIPSGADGKHAPKFVDAQFNVADFLFAFGNPRDVRSAREIAFDDDEEDEITYPSRDAWVWLRRIWAGTTVVFDNRVIRERPDQALETVNVYYGDPDQDPPSYFEGIRGAGNVPGYRSVAMVEFVDFDLTRHSGNATPQIIGEWLTDLHDITTDDGPAGICRGANGMIYAACFEQRTIAEIDPTTRKVVRHLARDPAGGYLGTLAAHPWNIACDVATGYLWVSCRTGHAVQVVDPADGSIVSTIAVDVYPERLEIAGGAAFITHPMADRITKIDTTTYTASAHVVDDEPWAIVAVGADLLVAGSRYIKRIRQSDCGLIESRRFGSDDAQFLGFFASGVCVSAADDKAWLSLHGSDYFEVVDPGDLAATAKQRASASGPADVFSAPDTPFGHVFAVANRGNSVTAYNSYRERFSPIGQLSEPERLVVTPNSNAWVTAPKHGRVVFVQLGR